MNGTGLSLLTVIGQNVYSRRKHVSSIPPLHLKDLRCDIYIQYRKLSDVVGALEKVGGRALKYGGEGKQQLIVPLVVEVDRTGYFNPTSVEARQRFAKMEAEKKQCHKTKYAALVKSRYVGRQVHGAEMD